VQDCPALTRDSRPWTPELWADHQALDGTDHQTRVAVVVRLVAHYELLIITVYEIK
jgi:hypothetical protein